MPDALVTKDDSDGEAGKLRLSTTFCKRLAPRDLDTRYDRKLERGCGPSKNFNLIRLSWHAELEKIPGFAADICGSCDHSNVLHALHRIIGYSINFLLSREGYA
jgi:hypothetical protein